MSCSFPTAEEIVCVCGMLLEQMANQQCYFEVLTEIVM
jgi:hypothetical protein